MPELAVFAALADPTRRHLLQLLVHVGRASATVLAGQVPVSRQMVVKHLRLLHAAGLVAGTRSGREVLYVARTGPLDNSARWLAELAASCRRLPENQHGTQNIPTQPMELPGTGSRAGASAL